MELTIEAHRLAEGLCVTCTLPAPYKRASSDGVNEDALLTQTVDRQTCVLAVADGAGGHPDGHEASTLVMECLITSLAGPDIRANALREPVLTALEACNRQLLDRAKGSLTTAAIVEIHQHTMRPYHVGDSSIVVVGQRGLIKYQSVSHSTVGFGIEAGLMDVEAAYQHEERHWVLNFVGTPEMRIELGAPLKLARFDTLMICSDAITDNLPMVEVCDVIRKGNLQGAMTSLVGRCEEIMSGSNGRPDDLSVILYRRES